MTGPFRIERRGELAILWMDDPTAPVNTLRAAAAEGFVASLASLEAASGVVGAVFASGKPDGFIAGADIAMLAACDDANDAAELARLLQRVEARMAALPFPLVAAVHGPALGGGLAITLPCAGCVASDDPRTRFGLPEVRIGVLPAGGCTQRLPRAIGLEPALDLMLTGASVDAARARDLGLVDEVVPAEHLIEAAMERALELSRRPGDGRGGRARRLRARLAADNPMGRRIVLEQAAKRVRAAWRGPASAPLRILDVVRLGLEEGTQRGLEAEAVAFGELVASAEATERMRLFLAVGELGRGSGVAAHPELVSPPPRRLGLVGGGHLVAGLASLATRRAGLAVRVHGRDHETVGEVLREVHGSLTRAVERGRMHPEERDRAMARVTGTTDGSGLQRVSVAILASVSSDEELEARARASEERIGDDAVLVSTTPWIPVARLAAAARRPERVVGIHFPGPVEGRGVAEVVATERAAPDALASCVDLVRRIGRTAVVVRDAPGFYTPRIQAPFLNEALRLVEEGVPVEKIDRALEVFGFERGPLWQLDELGVDVLERCCGALVDAFGDRMAPPAGLAKLVVDKRLGRRSGRGLYRIGEVEPGAAAVDERVYAVLGAHPANSLPDDEIVERTVLAMLNEAARCLDEGVLASAAAGDVAAALGLGFPAFRGGPFRHADAMGLDAFVSRLRTLGNGLGDRFTPAPTLLERARRSRPFHAPVRNC